MPFNFDDYKGENPYVGADEKAELAENNTVFTITGIKYEAENKFGPRFVVEVALDGEQRLISFPTGSVTSRDAALTALVEYLADEENEAPEAYLEKVGRAYVIRSAGL